MKIIDENPFRIFGVYSNASAKDITGHLSKAKALSNVGRTAKFDEDLSQVLPNINRNATALQQAQSQINLPEDKIKYALFWFCKVSPIDEVALGHLQVGNIDKALELFGKKTNYSSLINKGVLLMLRNSIDKDGIACLLKVIHDVSYRNAFVKAICGDIFQIEEEKLTHLFLDELLSEISANILYGICQAINISSLDCDYLKEKAVGEPIAKINKAIEQAKYIYDDGADENYKAGVNLVNQTEKQLAQVKKILGETDLQYQRIADNLAKTILQCGINYFNGSTDTDDLKFKRTMQLQEYALNIAVGSLIKSRCQENVDILNKQKKQNEYIGKIKADVDYVAKVLVSFQTQSKTIENATAFVNECIPHLQNIKNVLGSTDDLYLQISTAVANNALGMCVHVINATQNDPTVARSVLMLRINSALSAMTLIGSLDMTSSERNRFNTNHSTLKVLSTQVSTLLTPSYGENNKYPTSNPSRSSSTSSSNHEINWGCIIYIIITIIILICSFAGC